MFELQKASVWKRISAFLFDFIMISILCGLFAMLLSTVLNFDSHLQEMDAIQERYETEFGIQFDISQEDYDKLSDAEKHKYTEANDAYTKDEHVKATYTMLVSLTLLIASLSIFVAFLCLEVLVPVFLGNGQTLGKKIFAISLMRVDGVKVSTFQVIVRGLLGKYTVETMIPVIMLLAMFYGILGMTGGLVMILILVLEAFLVFSTRTNSMIHDTFAQTVVVDHASQRMFDTHEELLAYKARLHAEAAQQRPY